MKYKLLIVPLKIVGYHGDTADSATMGRQCRPWGDSADHGGNATRGDSGYHAETVLHGKRA